MTHCALLGVPSASVTNLMYQPAWTRFRFSGTVTVSLLPDASKSRAIDRWSTP